MRKVLFIITGLAYGGAEVYLKLLSFKVKQRGYQVEVLSLSKPDPDFTTYFQSVSIPLRDLGLQPGEKNPFVLIKAIKTIKEIKPDIVHTHMVHANILGRLVRPFVKIPLLINTAHNISEGGRFRELLYRYTDFLSDLTTNVSQNAADIYVARKLVPSHKMRYIPNGISTEEISRLTADEINAFDHEFGKDSATFVWLAVGRLSEQKDYPNLLKALDKINDSNLKILVLVAGEGDQRKVLEQQIKQFELTGKIKLLGLRKDVDKLMQYADAFVMSSAWEGLPIVLLEATKFGLPIVATNVGGNEELVKSEKNGFLVEPKNPDELAKAMKTMMNMDDKQRLAFRRNSLEIVRQNFSIDKIIDTWIDLYDGNAVKR